MPALAGTDFDTDFGMRIQGTDSAGVAAMATITFQDTITGVTAIKLGSGANYVDIQGIKVTWGFSGTVATAKHFVTQSHALAQGLRVRYCVALAASSTFSGSIVRSQDANALLELAYNILVYSARGGSASGLLFCNEDGVNKVHHNIIVVDGAIANNEFVVFHGNEMGTASQFRVYNNTFYLTSNFSESGTLRLVSMTETTPTGGSPTVLIKDNVYYWVPASQDMTFSQFSATNPALYTIDIGYNHFFYPAGNNWGTEQPYEDAFDPNGNSPASNDIWLNDSQAAAVPFNDITSATFAWDFEGSSYTYTLPWDLRMVAAYRTISSTGGVPGAVTSAISVPVISVASTLVVKTSIVDSITATIPVSNTGTGDLIVSAVTLAAVSDSGSTITMATRAVPWTIAEGATDYLTITFRPTTYPSTATATITLASNDLVTPSKVVAITGTALPNFSPGASPSVGVNNPALVNSPNLKEKGLNVGLHLRKNTDYEWDFTVPVGGFADTVTNLKIGMTVLATNTGLTTVAGLGLSGYNKLMVQPVGGQTVLQAGSASWIIKDGGCVVLANMGSLTTFKMSNPSLFKEITVHIFASGGTLVDADPRTKRTGSNENTVSD